MKVRPVVTFAYSIQLRETEVSPVVISLRGKQANGKSTLMDFLKEADVLEDYQHLEDLGSLLKAKKLAVDQVNQVRWILGFS